MKKIAIVCFVLLSFVLPLCSVQIIAADYGTVTQNETVKVTQIIDGDSFIAVKAGGQPVLIRLIGVDPVDYDASVLFLNNLLMGRQVRVSPEWQQNEKPMWNPCYVYLDGEFVNRTMIETGNAKVNEDHVGAVLYGELARQEERAEDKNLGLWARAKSTVASSFAGASYSGGIGVNINTASRSELTQRLNISSSVAAGIIDYREENPFNEVMEIKFVEGFTQEMYEDNLRQMTVATNILAATEEELLTLGISQSEAEDILDFEDDEGFDEIEDLYRERLISRSEYNRIRPFVAMEDVESIRVTEPEEEVVNVNAASYEQLRGVGLPSDVARDIINSRTFAFGYAWKSLGEMAEVVGMSGSELDMWADNLTCLTDVNSAYESELRSLGLTSGAAIDAVFGGRPYADAAEAESILNAEGLYEAYRVIYADEPENGYVNINTASEKELLAVGFSETEADAIRDRQGRMREGSDIADAVGSIPIIRQLEQKISLFTNINSASEKELLSLSEDMTEDIASDIIDYREDGYFGDLDEVRDFFADMDEGRLYRDIEDFIAVR